MLACARFRPFETEARTTHLLQINRTIGSLHWLVSSQTQASLSALPAVRSSFRLKKGAIPHFDSDRSIEMPGCRSLGLTWAFRRSKLLRFHSILSLRFRYFAKLCNYVIRHHTPLIVFSMEMAPCCLGLMVYECLHHNLIAVYYTFDVYRSPLSSSY